MLSKIFGMLFSGTSQAIEAIKIGQTDLKKQIKAAVNIIEGIQAGQTDQSDNFKVLQLQINKIKQEIKIPHVQRADFDTVLNSLNSAKLDIERLQAQVDAIKAQPQPQPEIIPAEIEVQPEPSKATAKARAMTQTRAKVVKQVNNTGILPWSDFQNVLKRALKVTPKRGIIPVLNTVKIEFKGNDTAIISTTDLDNYYTALLDSDHFHSLTGHKILINRDQAEKLSKVRGMVVFMSGTDRNEPQDKAYTVKADNFKDYIYSLPSEDHPNPPTVSESTNILVSESGLISSLLKSRSSQATDTAKSILTGTVLVRDSGERISIASTDGYKLFVDELPVINNSDWDEMILSPKLVGFMSEFKSHNQVSISRDHDFIRVDLQTGEAIYSKLLCGKYPAFRKILPKQFNHTLTVNRKELLDLAIEAKPFVNKQTKIISFQINHADITATVDQVTTDIDQAATDAQHQKYFGFRRDKVAVYKKNTIYKKIIDCQLINPVTIPEKISFNRDYLESVLKTFDCETITICMNSEIQPVIITAQKYDERQTMIMPIKP